MTLLAWNHVDPRSGRRGCHPVGASLPTNALRAKQSPCERYRWASALLSVWYYPPCAGDSVAKSHMPAENSVGKSIQFRPNWGVRKLRRKVRSLSSGHCRACSQRLVTDPEKPDQSEKSKPQTHKTIWQIHLQVVCETTVALERLGVSGHGARRARGRGTAILVLMWRARRARRCGGCALFDSHRQPETQSRLACDHERREPAHGGPPVRPSARGDHKPLRSP